MSYIQQKGHFMCMQQCDHVTYVNDTVTFDTIFSKLNTKLSIISRFPGQKICMICFKALSNCSEVHFRVPFIN